MTIDHDEQAYEPPQATSPTDHILTELQLHGYRPFQDEPDPRPLPEARIVAAAVADIFDALIASLSETRLEPDLEDLLCRPSISSTVPTSASNANSTTTNRRRSAASETRMAPKSARSNSSVSLPRA